MYTQKKNSVQMYTQKKNSVQMYTHSRIIYEMNNEHISTQLSLSCIHCKKIFKTRQVKYNHLTMNRCPELKKLIDAGEVEPRVKKAKVDQSVIVRSEPNPPPPSAPVYDM